MSESTQPPSPPISWPLFALALGVWALSTFGHGVGLEVAGSVFRWAKSGNTWLSTEGGPAGMHRLELLLALGCGVVVAGVTALLAFKIRALRPSRERLLAEVVPWVVWALATYLIWKVYIVYATELTHFVQYALVGFLIALAWRRGRDPQAAFLVAASLGVLDELWQHYLLPREHQHVMDHWMDWSDPVLDALGAVGGILPFVTLARLRGDALPDTLRRLKVAFVGAACALLPLLLLGPVTQAVLLGHYKYSPYWWEYDNDKPVHWPGPVEGVPLVLCMLLLLGLLVEPRRRSLGQGGLAVLLALAVVAVQPPSRERGMPVHEVVPHARAKRAGDKIVVDGVLEEAWNEAQRLGPFVNSHDGSPATQGATYARVLWDSERIYFAFEVEDHDVWARDLERDDDSLPADEVVEVFLDDGGDETTYFELEVSPRNVVQDLFCWIPRAPVDFDTGTGFQVLNAWDARGLETAVTIDGDLDLTAGFWKGDLQHGGDAGWVVELSLPWKAIAPHPGISNVHRPVPPRPGDRWRLGLYRIERPRAPQADLADKQAALSLEEGWARVERLDLFKDRAELEKVMRDSGYVTADGRLQAWRLMQVIAARRAEFQAWAPTHHGSFHKPAWFGVLEFE